MSKTIPDRGLTGGGEMGALMRARDWSRTPVGPPDRWPQSLRTAVSIVLESRFAMYIAWGRDYTQFYNDGYRPILGSTKHPAALGQQASTTFAESWQIIGPMFDGVLAGEAVGAEDWMLPLDRHGYLEECYFTFSYSPIRAEGGEVGGVLVTVSETTTRVLHERRLRTLRDLAAVPVAGEDAAWQGVAAGLAGNPLDLAFALLYTLDADGRTVRLVAATPAEPDPVLAPPQLELATELWPFAAAMASGAQEVAAISTRIAAHPGPKWPEPVDCAVVLPIARPGIQTYGFLVVGVSPRRRLDDKYRDFLGLVADQVATGIANARTHQEERQRIEALAQLDQAKTAFFSNVSHELRTPLTLMLGPIEDALASSDQRIRPEDLETVHRNARRLLKLVNQLLDFSRIEARRARVHHQPTDLASLTIDLASAFRSAIDQAGLELVVDCPPLASLVQVDPQMWENIVLNLLSNAFKFTLVGSITVALRDVGDRVVLAVRDTGVGIPPEHLPRVFERFHRIEGSPARTHEGSGIGLALVKDLVELHAGTIAVTSELGRGTELRVEIPRLAQEVQGTPISVGGPRKQQFGDEALRWLPVHDPVRAPSGAQAATHILVADDNADMRRYVSRLLGQHWSVETVSDGALALAAVHRTCPDLVLADVMMPGIDGFELVRLLRADPRTAALPIILLSARAGEDATAEGLRSGADDYIVKPFTAATLVMRVEAQLAALRMREAARQAAARERAHLYALVMESPAAVCWLRGPELVIEVANAHILELWDRPATVIGAPLLEAIPQMVGSELPELLREVMRTGVPFHADGVVARIDRTADRTSDGGAEDCYFDHVYAPTRDPDGTVSGVFVFAIDVTQQVVARRALEVALADARSSARAKDEFLALLGHELRNPLAPILTAVELMHVRGFANVERECAVIERQTQHLVRLVDDLLDVARIVRGKIELDKKRVELVDVVTKSAEMASPLFEQRRHRLDIDVPLDLLLDVDVGRMAQVFANLLTNAAKYTEPGGHVTVAARRDGEHIVVTVTDNGIGMSPEMLPTIFEMFVQERQALDRARGGLGLGLTIVRSLVAQHGGVVGARSAGRGRGSEFEVRLPGTTAMFAPDAEDAVSSQIRTSRTARRVLIVDDNDDAAHMLSDAVSALGHTTEIAHDGPSALEVVEAFDPDVALVDIGLPVMDGYELGRRLRTVASLGRMRLVAVTGYGQASDRTRSHAAGFDAHLVKPVHLSRLVALFETLMPAEPPSA